MDFLDPKAERRHHRRLFVGYALIALIVGFVSILLLYRSYGYGVGKDGTVKQGGLVFVSSQPKGADVYLDGKLFDKTDTRLSIDSGVYDLRVSRTGYLDWQRTVSVAGGDLQRFDYPLLIPKQLKTTVVGSAISQPKVVTQSPDRRWILVGDGSRPGVFISYDIKSPKKPVISEFVIPSSVYALTATEHTWELVEWSNDNVHVLLKHTFTEGETQQHEFVLVNRESPDKSRNITKDLSLGGEDEPTLFDKKAAKYFVYSPTAKTLRLVSADGKESALSAGNVLAYKTYSDDTLLYVTNTFPAGHPVSDKVFIVLQRGLDRKLIRSMPVSDKGYLLDIAKYDDNWYAAISGIADGGVYIYKNPDRVPAEQNRPKPWRFIKIQDPSYMAFSRNTRFLLAQSGDAYAVYDAETTDVYKYGKSATLAAPQIHAEWLDGHRLMYVSDNRVTISDYDNGNDHSLMPADPAYTPFASPDFRYLFTMTKVNEGIILTSTSFIVEQ